MNPSKAMPVDFALSLCPNGYVSIRLGPMVLDLPRDDFRDFARKTLKTLLALDYGIRPKNERKTSK